MQIRRHGLRLQCLMPFDVGKQYKANKVIASFPYWTRNIEDVDLSALSQEQKDEVQAWLDRRDRAFDSARRIKRPYTLQQLGIKDFESALKLVLSAAIDDGYFAECITMLADLANKHFSIRDYPLSPDDGLKSLAAIQSLLGTLDQHCYTLRSGDHIRAFIDRQNEDQKGLQP